MKLFMTISLKEQLGVRVIDAVKPMKKNEFKAKVIFSVSAMASVGTLLNQNQNGSQMG
jgi:hypothetical protein